jgi:hypothetical protein
VVEQLEQRGPPHAFENRCQSQFFDSRSGRSLALFAGDPEAGVQGPCGIAADPDVKLFGFLHPCLSLGAPEAQLVFAHREPHSLLLAGGEQGSLEAFEFANRAEALPAR